MVFRSQDEDSAHIIRSTIAENSIINANFTALCVIKPALLQIEVLHCGNRDFWPFLLPWRWPWPDDLRIQTRPVSRAVLDERKRTSYVKAFECYRL